jgi:hypothetical protein
MDRAELLALMDLNMFEMYREIARATSGGFVVERAGLVMCGSPLGTVITNMAMVADTVGVDVVRVETDRVFRREGLPFSVWTRAHADGPLETALGRAGFLDITSTPGMAFAPGDGIPGDPPADVEIRPVTNEAGRVAYADIMAEAYAVYGAPRESTRAHFARLASVVGPTTQAYLAHRAGRPVAGAILYLTHGIGGVGWVGTHPDSFGHGCGTAVTWRVVQEGLARGARFLNLQASPMGAPVYRRMGFSTPTQYRVFVAPD